MREQSIFDIIFKSRLGKNTLILVGGDLIAKLLGLLTTTILYARILGEQGFGVFGFVFTFSQLFLIFPDLGLHRWAVQHLANQKDQFWPLFQKLMSYKKWLAFYTLVIGSLIGFYFVWAKVQTIPHLYLMMFLSLATVCLRGVKQNCETLFHSYQDMQWPAKYNFIFRLLTFLITPALLYFTGNILLLFVALFLIEVLDYIVQRAAVENLYSVKKPEPYQYQLGQIIKSALPFSIQIFATMMYFFMDVIVMYFLLDDWEETIGYYNAGYRIVLAALVIPTSLCNVLYPAMAERRDTPGASLRIFYMAVPLYLVMGLGFVMIILPFSAFWVNLLYGKNQFSDTIPLLGLLSLSFPLYCITMAVGTYLGATLRQHLVMAVGIVMVFANLILNLLWIPLFGAYGAALATIATEVIVLLGFFGCIIFTFVVKDR